MLFGRRAGQAGGSQIAIRARVSELFQVTLFARLCRGQLSRRGRRRSARRGKGLEIYGTRPTAEGLSPGASQKMTVIGAAPTSRSLLPFSLKV